MTAVGIVGSRDYPRLDRVKHFVATLPKDTIVVSGGARGVDRAAEETARRFGLRVVSFRVIDRHDGYFNIERWMFDGDKVDLVRLRRDGTPSDGTTADGAFRNFAAAAYTRNGYLVEFADEVVAYWDGRSRGTRDSISRAREAEKLRDIIRPWREGAPIGPH